MKRDLQGEYITTTTAGERVQAFVPAPLPPQPDIEWSSALRQQFEKAHLALGRLDSLCRLLPDTGFFLYTYVRKEAVLSSMIEGTQSSLSDLLMYELDVQPGVPLDDVEEVSNYVAAMEHGLSRLQQGFPLSVRLFREMHEILLAGGRGSHKQPGELRKSQNWIGGTRPGNAVFVPPPPDHVADALASLEKFIHQEGQQTSTLLKAALVHVQFETIHPFLDGNGRLGRLLITLLLVSENVLQQPLLYLSLYFKTHRQDYYDLLNQIRYDGDWESWLQFFAEAVEHAANDAVQVAQLLREQSEQDAALIQEQGRYAGTLSRLHAALLKRPLATATWLEEQTSLANATVQSGLQRLIDIGILQELTGKQRGRVYAYKAYIEILNRENDF